MIKIKNIPPRLIFILKLFVTIFLFVIILRNVHWTAFFEALHRSNLILIAAVFGLLVANILLSAYKWKILLSIHGIYFEFKKLSRYYFTAFLFNNFFPTNIGGDGYRIYKTLKNPNSRAGAVTAILTERLSGILALLVIGFMAGMVGYIKDGDKFSQLLIALGAVGGLVVIFFLFLIFHDSYIPWILNLKFLPEKIKKVIAHIKDYRQFPSKMIQVILISILFHIIFILFRYLLILAVGADIPLYHLVTAVVLSTLVALIPISINGFGLMDGSFIFLLVTYGVVNEAAVVVMVLIRAMQIPVSLIGSLFYFLDKQTHSIKEMQVEKV